MGWGYSCRGKANGWGWDWDEVELEGGARWEHVGCARGVLMEAKLMCVYVWGAEGLQASAQAR